VPDNERIFPFDSVGHGWKEFTKYARIHFARVIRQASQIDPTIREKVKKLRNRDFCARLLYTIDMCASLDDNSVLQGEFNIDWALLFARPSSISQARQAVIDLIGMGLIEEIVDGKRNNQDNTDGANDRGKPDGGGNVGPQTSFDFEE